MKKDDYNKELKKIPRECDVCGTRDLPIKRLKDPYSLGSGEVVMRNFCKRCYMNAKADIDED